MFRSLFHNWLPIFKSLSWNEAKIIKLAPHKIFTFTQKGKRLNNSGGKWEKFIKFPPFLGRCRYLILCGTGMYALILHLWIIKTVTVIYKVNLGRIGLASLNQKFASRLWLYGPRFGLRLEVSRARSREYFRLGLGIRPRKFSVLATSFVSAKSVSSSYPKIEATCKILGKFIRGAST